MDTLTTDQPIRRPKHRRWQKFCQAVATGQSQLAAYHRHISRPPRERTAYEHACRLAGQFSAYIASLRRRIMEAADHDFIASKAELMMRDTRIIRTPGELAATAESDLATVTVTHTPDGTVTKIQGPDKDSAAARLVKTAGYDAPQQIQVSHQIIENPALARLMQLSRQADGISGESINTTRESRVIEAQVISSADAGPDDE